MAAGPIANLIVVDLARREGIAIDWNAHARIGLPVTLAIVWGWLLWGGCAVLWS